LLGTQKLPLHMTGCTSYGSFFSPSSEEDKPEAHLLMCVNP
jgi:hypothetical protein